jgi:preprotein translocase subunit SecD
LTPQLPKDTRVVFEKFENAESLAAGRRPYLVKTDSHLTGAQLEDASVHQDEYNRPEVNFRFTIEGRKLFAELTTKAAGGQLAIVLDDVVKSAPSVQKEIDSDSARITLGGGRDYNTMFNEAQFIATSLRAGALPAALVPMEERTVGPSLGSDSIKKAQMASMIAALLVFAWMLIYYRTAGFIADISLVLNVFLTFAVLTSLGATLTLPGVAGIALVIGMAVDANVIVYERIKEELRKGSSGLGAIREGFHHAFTSIFDANMTTVLTCLVLMYYGTGPVRGFAVSLAIGMVTSMFTAIFFSRTVLDTLVGKFGMTLFTVAETKPAANN